MIARCPSAGPRLVSRPVRGAWRGPQPGTARDGAADRGPARRCQPVYKWTATEGKLEELAAIYSPVTAAMEANEPGAEAVHVYASEADSSLYARDEFADAEAVAFHLTETAATHFASLLEIATPGPFFFMGEVPEELQAAANQVGLAAEFSTHTAGFDR